MRILGIDLGTTRAKMVEIDTVFSKFEIQEYHELDIEGSEAVGVHIAQFIERLPRTPDKICVLLPASRGTFRNLRFPTKDKKAIRSSLEFELEDELPFDVDQSVMSWSIMSQGNNSSDLHVAASLENSFAEWFDRVIMGGFDPDVVTSEAWALKNLLNRIFAKEPPQKPVLVLELGDRRSLIYAHHDGKPILARELNWGGRDLTQKLAEYYSIPVDQAEKAKKESGFVLPVTDSDGVSPDQIEFSNVIRAAFEPLVTSLRQSLFACKNITKEHPETIYLSGGTSQMPGLLPSLEEEFKIKCTRLSSMTRRKYGG
jgi:type IV pilus assembly protein PilM